MSELSEQIQKYKQELEEIKTENRRLLVEQAKIRDKRAEWEKEKKEKSKEIMEAEAVKSISEQLKKRQKEMKNKEEEIVSLKEQISAFDLRVANMMAHTLEEERKSQHLCEHLDMIKSVNKQLELKIVGLSRNQKEGGSGMSDGGQKGVGPTEEESGNREETKNKVDCNEEMDDNYVSCEDEVVAINNDGHDGADSDQENETEPEKEMPRGNHGKGMDKAETEKKMEEVKGKEPGGTTVGDERMDQNKETQRKDDGKTVHETRKEKHVYMCSFYRNNKCNKTHEQCPYLHISGNIEKICNAFRSGLTCGYGDGCKYRHSILNRNEEICKYQEKRGGCRNGNNCKYYHLNEDEEKQKEELNRKEKNSEGDDGRSKMKETEINDSGNKNGGSNKPTEKTDGTKNEIELGEEVKQMIQAQLLLLMGQLLTGKVQLEGGGGIVRS